MKVQFIGKMTKDSPITSKETIIVEMWHVPYHWKFDFDLSPGGTRQLTARAWREIEKVWRATLTEVPKSRRKNYYMSRGLCSAHGSIPDTELSLDMFKRIVGYVLSQDSNYKPMTWEVHDDLDGLQAVR